VKVVDEDFQKSWLDGNWRHRACTQHQVALEEHQHQVRLWLVVADDENFVYFEPKSKRINQTYSTKIRTRWYLPIFLFRMKAAGARNVD
jgi:hypothetical protein